MTSDASTERSQFRGAEQAIAYLIEAIGSASRNLIIYSEQLDHAVFDQSELVAAVSAFARSSAHARVEILFSNSKNMVNRGHKLVELARRLPSHIDIRKRSTEEKELRTFVIADRSTVWVLPDWRLLDGYRDLNSPAIAQSLLDRFEELDRRSTPDPELKVLKL